MSLLDTFAIELIQPPAGLEREIVFAIRRDGQHGSGTNDDPYNGSNVTELDDILNDDDLVPENAVIRFGPGIFQTRGFAVATTVFGWRLRTGHKLIGAGQHQTTLQLVDYRPNGDVVGDYWASVIGNNAPVKDVAISDLTLDANLHHQPLTEGKDIRTQCIQILAGARVKVRRVRCINWGSHSRDLEGFPIYIHGFDNFGIGACENIVEDCTMDLPDLNPAREATLVGSSRVDLQACKLEYSIVSPK